MKNFSYISKYKLQEALYIVGFFIVLFMISMAFNTYEDFPLVRGMFGALFLGLMSAWFEIGISPKLQKRINAFVLMIISMIYYYFLFAVMVICYGYINLIFKVELPLSEAFDVSIADMYPQGSHEAMFYFFIYIVILQLFRELRMRTGRGVIKKYLLGKLNKPMPSNRIFIFMDLTSSTTYAEKLGHQKYSSFIQDIYLELDEFIIATQGSLYQYVGDEVVVSWSVKDGLKNNNCLNFFYLVSERMKELEDYYNLKFGVVPKFKAGLHFGEVAIAEVGGILKRELAFHGDVVNTTARICAKCSSLNEPLLISEDIAEELKTLDDNYGIESVGSFNLKGKKNEVGLFRVVKHDAFSKQIVEEKISYNKEILSPDLLTVSE